MDWQRRLDTMEAGAWYETGKVHRRKIVGFRLFIAALPYLALAALVGGLGYGAYWAWGKATSLTLHADVPTYAATGVPALIWVAVVIAVAGGFWVVSPRRPIMPSTRVLRLGVTLTALAAVTGVWLGFQ